AESDYELMWAQDVAVMAGYHLDASAVVSALQAFSQPVQALAGSLGGAVKSVVAAAEEFVANSGLADLGGFGNGFGNFSWGYSGTGNFGSLNMGNFSFGIELSLSSTGLFNSGFSNWGFSNWGSPHPAADFNPFSFITDFFAPFNPGNLASGPFPISL